MVTYNVLTTVIDRTWYNLYTHYILYTALASCMVTNGSWWLFICNLHDPAVDSKQFIWDLKTYRFDGCSKC